MTMTSKEITIASISVVIDLAETKINDFLSGKIESLAIVSMSKDIAIATNNTYSFVYALVNAYASNVVGLKCVKGKGFVRM